MQRLENLLEKLRLMIGMSFFDHFNESDVEMEQRLRIILENTFSRLCLILGVIDPPDYMDYIILEVAIMRFNRIGSEGLSSHSVEGESLTFSDDDFGLFSADIQAFLDTCTYSDRGKVRFL